MPSGIETFDALGRLKCSISDRMGRVAAYYDLGGFWPNSWSYTVPSNVEYQEIIAFAMMIYGPGSMWGYEEPKIAGSGRTMTFTATALTALPAATWRCFVVLR
jgi:hypothetical protein